jgi:hypothetical protein
MHIHIHMCVCVYIYMYDSNIQTNRRNVGTGRPRTLVA